MPLLIPAPLAGDTVEALFAERSRRPPLIYSVLVIFGICALAALPLVRVPVTAQSPGIIRSEVARHAVHAPYSGRIEVVAARENDRVSRGALLLRIQPTGFASRDSLLVRQKAELEDASAGLRRLDDLASAPGSSAMPASFRFQQELAQHRYAMEQQRSRIVGLERDLDAARALYDRQVGPRLDVEQLRWELKEARLEADMIVARDRARWRQEREERERLLEEVVAQHEQLRAERGLGEVLAPVAGSIEEFVGISPGSYVQVGAPLVVISPAADLSAEALVGPREIGLIHAGMEARLAIDAFPYLDWGFVPGRVEQIPADATVIDGTPLYRVRISIDQDYLSLRSGVRGTLRKGMTIQAKFTLSERTLLQLVRDDVSDWLDPSRRDDVRPYVR